MNKICLRQTRQCRTFKRGVGQEISKRGKGEVLAHQHEGDSRGDCLDGDSGSEAELVVEGGQGPLQPSPRKRVLVVESVLPSGRLAPKMLREETTGQFDQGRRQEKGKGRRRGGVGGGGQGHSKRSRPGLGVDPGGAGLVAGTV